MLVLTGKRQRIESVRFSPDGRSIVAPAYLVGLQMWSGLPTPGNPRLLSNYTHIRDALFTPDGAKVLAVESTLVIHDLVGETSAPVVLWSSGASAQFNVTPDGQRVVVVRGLFSGQGRIASLPVDRPDFRARHWEQRFEQYSFMTPQFFRGGELFVVDEVWRDDPTGAHDWFKYNRFRYVVRSTRTGEIVSATQVPRLHFLKCVSPDGSRLAGVRGVWLGVYSADDFSKPLVELRNDSRKEFTGAAFHPSGRYLATASNDTLIRFWDTRTWAVTKTFTWDAGKMRSVAFSPDGALAAAGTDTGRVVVWDLDL